MREIENFLFQEKIDPSSSIAEALMFFALSNSPLEEFRAKAGYLTELYYRYYRRNESLITRLSSLQQNTHLASGRSSLFTSKGQIVLNKEQPSYLDSVFETNKRLLFLETFLENLPKCVSGCISGGSMQYGRFYNVRGGYPDSSDLDLIMVLNSLPSEDDIDALLPLSLGFDPDEVDLFAQRILIYSKLLMSGKAEVLSHKFTLPRQYFDVSMHFFLNGVFYDTFSSLPKQALGRKSPSSHVLKDYKASPLKNKDLSFKDFLGNEEPFDVRETFTEKGVITLMPVFDVSQGILRPATYSNIPSPLFEVALDRADITETIKNFEVLLREQVAQQKKNKSDASLSRSHNRYRIFSPYIIQEVDNR